jgi:hypothetical protein
MCQPYLQGPALSQYLEDLNNRRLFVKYVPKNLSNEGFEQLFVGYGEVDFGYVVKDPRTKQSKGFGYITFKNVEVTKKVANLGCIKIFGSKKLKIFEYKRRGDKTDNPANKNSPNLTTKGLINPKDDYKAPNPKKRSK